MNYTSKGTMNATSGGAFRRKIVEEATQLIEELAKSNYRAPFEASGSSSRMRGGGVIDLNNMSGIKAKLDTIINRMDNQERRGHSYNEVGNVEGAGQKCVGDEGLAHEGPYQVEEAQYINGNKSYNFKPNNNLPTHYTLRTFLMEVECSRVQDQCKISSRIMHHQVSKDNNRVVKQ